MKKKNQKKSQKESKNDSKKKKNKGPIRFEAIIPILLVVGLVFVYGAYFMDGHLRRALEWGGTYANGAEVNVGWLDLQWKKPGLLVKNIQVTNGEEPNTNILEIGSLNLDLKWDALLRGKLVAPEAQILGVATGSPRKRPGRVLPRKDSGGQNQGVLEQAAQKTIDHLMEKHKSTLLSDLINIAGGTNYKEQLKKLESEIGTKKFIKDLSKEIKIKEKNWKERIAKLPSKKTIQSLEAKIKTFKFQSKSALEVQKSLKEINSIYKDVESKIKSIKEARTALKTDLKSTQGRYKKLEKSIKDDIKFISDKLHIPSLDGKEISEVLLGNVVGKYLREIEKYKNLAREYMPASKEPVDTPEALTPRERADGKNYRFLVTHSYPRFLVQNLVLSSNPDKGDFSGDIKGSIQNITDAPAHYGSPLKAKIEGDFPGQKIMGILAEFTVDHTGDIPKESATLSVKEFPLKKHILNKTKELLFGYEKALGSTKLDLGYEAGSITVNAQSVFSAVDYIVDTQSKDLKKVLNGVVKELGKINLNFALKGQWDDLDLSIRSNLGDRIIASVKGQVQKKVKEAKGQVEKHVRGLIANEKGKIGAEIKKFEQKYGVDLKNKDTAVSSIKNRLNQLKEEAKNREKKKLKQKATKEIDKLKKKFKLPF